MEGESNDPDETYGPETYGTDEYDGTDIIVDDGPDEDIIMIMKNYKKHKKTYKTSPTLTKYERTKILSERASQINEGSTILISNPDIYSNAYDIAVAEFNEKLIPFILKRPYGDHYEYWKINDLI